MFFASNLEAKRELRDRGFRCLQALRPWDVEDFGVLVLRLERAQRSEGERHKESERFEREAARRGRGKNLSLEILAPSAMCPLPLTIALRVTSRLSLISRRSCVIL